MSARLGPPPRLGRAEVQFDCLPLPADAALVRPAARPKGFQRKATYWYAPDVRRWVKSHITTPQLDASEELLSYKLNED